MPDYVFSSYVTPTSLPPVFPEGKCGNSIPDNYCRDDLPNMVSSMALKGDELYVARLGGKVTRYVFEEDAWTGPELVKDLALTQGSAREIGADMAASEDFESDRTLFVSHTSLLANGNYTASIERWKLDVAGKPSEVSTIYSRTGPEVGANAHNLHLLTTAAVSGEKVVLAAFGDLNRASIIRDPSHDYGKVLLMDYEGGALPKSRFDTGYPNNMHLAYGNRNLYRAARLLGDPRYAWGENGNAYERSVVYSLLSPKRAHDLAWSGMDDAGWLEMNDPSTGSAAVLYRGNDQGGIWVEPYLDRGNGVNLVLHSYMASDLTPMDETSLLRYRTLNLEYIGNLDAPQPAGFQVIEQLAYVRGEGVSSPMAAVVHRSTGDVLFGDVFTGNLYRLAFHNASLFAATTLSPNGCGVGNRWTWAELAPTWLWFVLASCLVLILCMAMALCQLLYPKSASAELVVFRRRP